MKRSRFLTLLFGIFALPSFKEETTIVKTKIVFTPDMLMKNNYGLFIINNKVKDVRINPGYAATVSWKLCYHNGRIQKVTVDAEKGYGVSFNRCCMVNFLTDGWVCPIGNSDEEVCDYLNNNPYNEEYRLMTKDEVIFLLTNRKQGFLI